MKMKDYLLDTNIAGHFAELKSGSTSSKSKILAEHLNKISNSSKIFITSISIGEIEYGYQVAPIEKQPDIKKLSEFLQSGNITILNVDKNIACDSYATIRSKLFEFCAPKVRKNKKKRIEEWIDPTNSKCLQIQENDLWISAVALSYNLILVSNDKMEQLKKILTTDLEFEDWLNDGC